MTATKRKKKKNHLDGVLVELLFRLVDATGAAVVANVAAVDTIEMEGRAHFFFVRMCICVFFLGLSVCVCAHFLCLMHAGQNKKKRV